MRGEKLDQRLYNGDTCPDQPKKTKEEGRAHLWQALRLFNTTQKDQFCDDVNPAVAVQHCKGMTDSKLQAQSVCNNSTQGKKEHAEQR